MGIKNLKDIDGTKIRRQYFNIPLIIFCTLAFVIPYTIFIISLCIGKLDPTEWPSTFWTSIWVCFCFSSPFLVLRVLNLFFFGRIICVLTKQGIHYPKGMIRWETVQRIEYDIDSKPRYKSDPAKEFRVILYTQGGKHVVLLNAPFYLLSHIKKYNKELTVKITGARSLLHVAVIMAAIFLLCPFYVVLLYNSPGVSVVQMVATAVIMIISTIIRLPLFDAYCIEYRFWRRILPKKWLSYIILGCYYVSAFVAILVLSYFPNWVVVSLVGIYLGVVQPPIPSRNGNSRNNRILSYEQLCDIYIKNADLWENNIRKSKEKKKRKRRKRGKK